MHMRACTFPLQRGSSSTLRWQLFVGCVATVKVGSRGGLIHGKSLQTSPDIIGLCGPVRRTDCRAAAFAQRTSLHMMGSDKDSGTTKEIANKFDSSVCFLLRFRANEGG